LNKKTVIIYKILKNLVLAFEFHLPNSKKPSFIIRVAPSKLERQQTQSIIRPSNDPSYYEQFSISNGWLKKCIEMCHLSSRIPTHKSQENKKRTLDEAEIIVTYLQSLNQVAPDYEPKFILKMDETPTYIDILAKRTIDVTCAKTINLIHTGH
jgi:hypothetical protein